MATQPEKKVLATAFSAKDRGGSGQDEPVAMTTEFGRGRCFNLVLGHNAAAMEKPGSKRCWFAGSNGRRRGRCGEQVVEDGEKLWRAGIRDRTRVRRMKERMRDLRPVPYAAVLKGVAQYKFGDNRAGLLTVERLTLGATDEAARKFLAAKYASLLAGPATADGKRFICRQLGLIGRAAEVPALERLLADEQFAFAARSALERIPGESRWPPSPRGREGQGPGQGRADPVAGRAAGSKGDPLVKGGVERPGPCRCRCGAEFPWPNRR